MTPLTRTQPLRRRGAKKKRTLSPRCSRQRCNAIARIEGWCVSHAEDVADTRFSLWVRARDGHCTARGMFGIDCDRGLAAAHIVGRRNHTTRFDPENVHALCNSHHVHVDQYGSEGAKAIWGAFVCGGWERYEDLLRRSIARTSRVSSIEEALRRYRSEAA